MWYACSMAKIEITFEERAILGDMIDFAIDRGEISDNQGNMLSRKLKIGEILSREDWDAT